MKEQIPACLSCGKALHSHDTLSWTCRKVQKLREALRGLLANIVVPDDDVTLNNRFDDAKRALDESA